MAVGPLPDGEEKLGDDVLLEKPSVLERSLFSDRVKVCLEWVFEEACNKRKWLQEINEKNILVGERTE